MDHAPARADALPPLRGTPVDDLPEPPRRRPLAVTVAHVGAGAAAGAAGALLVVFGVARAGGWTVLRHVVPGYPTGLPGAFGLVAAGVALSPGVIAVHEGGHVLAGRLVGFRFVALYLGPLQLRREGGRTRVRWNRRLGLYGGAALSVPTRWDGTTAFRRAFAWYVAGGPLASVAAGAAGLALGFAAGRAGAEGLAWRPALFVASVISLGIGLATLLPLEGRSGRSDGAQLRALVRAVRTPTARDDAQLAVTALGMTTHVCRPREWDEALVARVARWADERSVAENDAVTVSAAVLAYFHALDRGAVAAAHAWLQRGLDVASASVRGAAPASPDVRHGLALEAALFEAVWRRDPAVARAWLARVPARTRGAASYPATLVDAALAQLDGDHERAAAVLARAAAESRCAGSPAVERLYAAAVARLGAHA